MNHTPHLSKQELVNTLDKRKLLTPLVLSALNRAELSHGNQKRALGTPYLEEHIYPVVQSLIDAYSSKAIPELLVAAALLHDVLEDDPTYSASEMEKDFGLETLSIVGPLTKAQEENTEHISQDDKRRINERVLKGLYAAHP